MRFGSCPLDMGLDFQRASPHSPNGETAKQSIGLLGQFLVAGNLKASQIRCLRNCATANHSLCFGLLIFGLLQSVKIYRWYEMTWLPATFFTAMCATEATPQGSRTAEAHAGGSLLDLQSHRSFVWGRGWGGGWGRGFRKWL